MKFIPILFSTEMVQAILDGRKTMTRRILKPEPYLPFKKSKIDFVKGFGFCVRHQISKNPDRFECTSKIKCPYGQVGDILWVRETFNSDYSFKNSKGKPVAPGILYKATTENLPSKSDKWKPSLFMPKEACRIFLKINNIRVERLHDISEEDAISEGIEKYGPFGEFKGSKHPNGGSMRFRAYSKSTRAFQDLWETINSEESWKSNPWVWVIEFERIDKPENFLS